MLCWQYQDTRKLYINMEPNDIQTNGHQDSLERVGGMDLRVVRRNDSWIELSAVERKCESTVGKSQK